MGIIETATTVGAIGLAIGVLTGWRLAIFVARIQIEREMKAAQSRYAAAGLRLFTVKSAADGSTLLVGPDGTERPCECVRCARIRSGAGAS